MLYRKNESPSLPAKLFAEPTCEYRGTPFWAWNCRLEKDELLRQIEVLKKMGFGGFHMHVRSGMATEYLGKEFMDLVAACTEKAKSEKMLAWLYDEDRWPSGFAGGLVTREEKYRIRYLLVTRTPYEELGGQKREGSEAQTAKRSGNGKLLARFDIKLDENGCLSSYRMLGDGERAEGKEWFAYVESPQCSPRYNGYTYADLMNRAAIDRFIEVTHEKYYEKVGAEFGKTVPAIFTDEPQFTHKQTLPFPESENDVALPWTDDLPETFRAAYGEDIVPHIPELLWELPDGVSTFRYHYHDHACQRFVDGFASNLGGWCDRHGIALTGHMMREPSLSSQTAAVGEVMRSLSAFQLPGIDMLADRHEYTTAKQAASVAHQYGREGVMSELYGVTDWSYDFRGHKLQGDWQAALGVTVRVPHLSWVSMEGESKRDYPASINYQSSWWSKYSLVENHFARLNTALTRGRPAIRVGVVHPVESLWLRWGPSSQTEADRSRLDGCFESVTNWLLFGSVDFDYISESLLPSQCEKGGNPLCVGRMKYDAVVVPGCDTLRSTTLERLKKFAEEGGKLIFLGAAPKYMDAKPSDVPEKLWSSPLSVRTEFTRASLLAELEEVRDVDIRNTNGSRTGELFSALREDGKSRWLFVCRGTNPYNPDISQRQSVRITVRGEWKPTLYDTVTGKTRPVSFTAENGKTAVPYVLYPHDSLLLKLEPLRRGEARAAKIRSEKPAVSVDHHGLTLREAAIIPDEPNALLLDIFEYSFDGAPFEGPEEILRIDTLLRRRLGWEPWGGSANQPWCIAPEPNAHVLSLRACFDSDVSVKKPLLALEAAEDTSIRFDGKPVPSAVNGYYVDKSVKTVSLPEFGPGKHTVELSFPFGKRTAAERVYLLGGFGVKLSGNRQTVVRMPASVGFGDLCTEGFPFYGGAVTYRMHFDTSLPDVEIRIPHWRAAVYEISVDGRKPVCGAFAPYSTVFEGLKPGRHRLDVKLYFSRANAFGRIHCADELLAYPSPSAWRTSGDSWTYGYRLVRQGLLSEPVIREFSSDKSENQ